MYPAPGLLVVWSGTRPRSEVHAIRSGDHVFGRDVLGPTDDDRISREHFLVSPVLTVRDLGSRNGTFVNGQQVMPNTALAAEPYAVVRAGRTVAVLLDDVRDYDADIVNAQLVAGRRTAPLHASLRPGRHLLVRGGPGTGRGYVARCYADKLPSAKLLEDPYLPHDEVIALIDQLACDPALRLVITQNLIAAPFPPLVDELLKNHADRIQLPPLRERADEVAAIVDRLVRTTNPTLTCHARLIEVILLRQEGLSFLADHLYVSARMYDNQVLNPDDYDRAIRSRWAIQ